MNLKAFFEALPNTEAFPAKGLTNAQVQGIARLLDIWAQWYDERFPIQYLAAALDQIHHETGGRMQPVMETFSSTAAAAAQILEKAYVRGQLPWVKQRYWLPDGKGLIWIGRGDLQYTHKANYAKLRKAIKEAYDIDIPFDENPELIMDPNTSAVAAFEGLTKGLFRKAKLDDFYDADKGEMDYVGQRDIVNGDGKDEEIAAKMKRNGKLFEKALLDAGADKGFTITSERLLPGMGVDPKPGELVTQPVKPSKGEIRVRTVQERLHAHGYGDLAGKVDGLYGKMTAAAIDAFESSRNIKLDHVDAATLEALMKPAAGEKA